MSNNTYKFGIDPNKYYKVNEVYVQGKDLRIVDNLLEFNKYYWVATKMITNRGEERWAYNKKFSVFVLEIKSVILSKFSIGETDWTPENSVSLEYFEEFKKYLQDKFSVYYADLSRWKKFFFDTHYYALDIDEAYEEWRKKIAIEEGVFQ